MGDFEPRWGGRGGGGGRARRESMEHRGGGDSRARDDWDRSTEDFLRNISNPSRGGEASYSTRYDSDDDVVSWNLYRNARSNQVIYICVYQPQFVLEISLRLFIIQNNCRGNGVDIGKSETRECAVLTDGSPRRNRSAVGGSMTAFVADLQSATEIPSEGIGHFPHPTTTTGGGRQRAEVAAGRDRGGRGVPQGRGRGLRARKDFPPHRKIGSTS